MTESAADRAPLSRRESGQAVVETAIVMPLFVFILLGILQLSLMHQARLMTKYAAFKATRAGSIGNAGKDRMTKAALAVLMPFISEERNSTTGTFKVYKTHSGSEFAESWGKIRDNQQAEQKSTPHVEVMVCGPTKEILKGGAKEFSFDDATISSGDDWEPFDRTRLAIQVTLYYRMVIPYANMMIWNMAFGQEKADTLWITRTGTEKLEAVEGMKSVMTAQKLDDLAKQGVYVMPIRANWGMRMHSALFPDTTGYEIPATSECVIPFPKKGGGGGTGTVGGGGTEDLDGPDD